MTLISAPAGFGKTTLLSDWLGQHEGPVAWLSLDDQDDEVACFWTYLIAALQTAHADLGQDALYLLRAPQPPPAETVHSPLLNEIAALAQLSFLTSIVLVLDDYHLISSPQIHQGLAFLLEHQPPTLHLVIATRADPQLPIFRLRARGQLTELRSADLRFTTGEAAAFLNTVMGLDLASEDVKALEPRTEGWIVGLQLAAFALQGTRSLPGRVDVHQFIATFSGSHHYVLEYLTEEVVRRQPASVQRFLTLTFVLDRLCGPLCDALTGEYDGDAVLADLHRRNLFIVPLDDEHRWYRYHHLFADLLGNLLRKERPTERIRELYLRLQVDGFEVRLLTRDPAKAGAMFGASFEVVSGDVADVASLEEALVGCDGVHISIAGPAELLAAQNVAALAPGLGLKRITYISGATAFEQNRWFPMTAQKLAAEESIRACGVPYTIFCPTWPLEMLPRYARGGQPLMIGDQPLPVHWFAADDLARMISAAYRREEAAGHKLFVYGPEAITTVKALARYCRVFHPEVESVPLMPIEAARAAAASIGNQMLGFFAELMAYFEKVGEPGDPTEANELLGAPQITLEAWIEQRKS